MKFESSQRSQIREARLRKLKRAFCFTHNLISEGQHLMVENVEVSKMRGTKRVYLHNV